MGCSICLCAIILSAAVSYGNKEEADSVIYLLFILFVFYAGNCCLLKIIRKKIWWGAGGKGAVLYL